MDSDRDGDGLSNTEETANGSDPDDPNSVNYPPTNIFSNQQLAFEENLSIGSVIASFIAEDQDTTDSHIFSLVSGEGSTHNDLFNLSADGKLMTKSTFDFENNASVFTVRVRVKDKGSLSYEKPISISLLDSDVFSPLTLGSNLMLWLDAMDRSSLDQGEFRGELGIPEDGNQVKFWADKSGKEYHAKSIEGAATYKAEEVYGKPTVYFQNNTFEVLNSAEDFDGWDKMTVLLVLEQKARQTWSGWIGKWNQVNHVTNSSWHFLGRRPDLSTPQYSFRINGTTAVDRIELSNNLTSKLGAPSIITLLFGNNQRRVFLNGTSAVSYTHLTLPTTPYV